MAVTITRVTGASTVWGNKRARVRDLVFSSNYATGGESVVASDVNLKTIEQVVIHGGVAAASDLATAIPVFYDYTTSKFTFYEGSAAGTALSEKTNAEAYPTGCKLRATFIGY
jgi:hypothetical protein